MIVPGVLLSHSLITSEKCKQVEQCRSIRVCYYSRDNSRSYDDIYTRDAVSGLWNWVSETYDEDGDDWDPIKASCKPSINTETVIEYVRENVHYNDALVLVD